MPRSGRISLIVIFIYFTLIFFSYAEVVSKILVIVNDEVITQGEVNRILIPIYKQYKELYTGQEFARKLDEARRNVLQKLIQDKLLLTEGKRRKIEAGDEEVEIKIESLRKRFPDEEEFKKTLERENILLSELEKKIKERIIIDKLIDMEIRRRVSISPSEIVEYYESHRDEFEEPEKIKLKSILVKISEDRPEKESLELAKRILARLEEGANFGLLAEEYSDGPYAESAGDMGWVKPGELMPKINDTIFTLEENQFSGILKTNLGFHIFKVEEKNASRARKFDEARDDIERILFSNKLEEHLGRWLENLKKDAYIAFR
ncbi:MAG: peptidylprolyl isomerase [Candidatus Omnitrophota bacterium]|nr:MAG: peptidylprolyl isomerase [Candidatus Omnitrophota bacterium]